MNYLIYIILGIIQGFTEPIPVIRISIFSFKNIFNSNMFNDLNFEIVSNFGSFLAILFIFRKDVGDLLKAFFTYIFNKDKRDENKQKFKYCMYIIVSTIPIVLLEYYLKILLRQNYKILPLLGFAFLFTAFMLLLVRKKNGKKEDFDITLKDALIVGFVSNNCFIPWNK